MPTYKCGSVNSDEPSGYIDWAAWAELKKKTHDQQRCPTCGLYHLWVPKEQPPARRRAPEA